MEATGSSEILVTDFQRTRLHILADVILHYEHPENIRCHIISDKLFYRLLINFIRLISKESGGVEGYVKGSNNTNKLGVKYVFNIQGVS